MSGRNTGRADAYSRVTGKIIADLEKGVRTWLRPWTTEHAAGCVSRPLRASGEAYRGINVVMLWAAAVEAGYACPTWMWWLRPKRHTRRRPAPAKNQTRKP